MDHAFRRRRAWGGVNAPRASGSLRRLLFVRTDRLGETVLNLPAVHAFRLAFPDWRLLLWVQPSLRPLFLLHPDVDEVLSESLPAAAWWRRAWTLSRQWRVLGIGMVVVSNPKKEYHVAAWLSGIPTCVGHDRKCGWLLTHRLPRRQALGVVHEVEYNVALLTALDLPRPATLSYRLPVQDDAARRLAQRFETFHVRGEDRLVGVHPWTSNPRKQWPVERFRALVERLSALDGVRPVLIGGMEERRNIVQVVSDSSRGVIDVVGRLPVEELAACLSRVRLLVTNDSGPMHVAAAVGTPVVALFGTDDAGSHPRRWGPWGDGHTVIHKPLHEITVDEVVSAVQRYL